MRLGVCFRLRRRENGIFLPRHCSFDRIRPKMASLTKSFRPTPLAKSLVSCCKSPPLTNLTPKSLNDWYCQNIFHLTFVIPIVDINLMITSLSIMTCKTVTRQRSAGLSYQGREFKLYGSGTCRGERLRLQGTNICIHSTPSRPFSSV